MNGAESDRFWELARKIMANNATIIEREELVRLLAEHPSFVAEYEGLRRDMLLAEELLPLLDAVDAPAINVPDRARERLKAKVRKVAESREVTEGLRPGPDDRDEFRVEQLLDAESAQAMETACRENGLSVISYVQRRGFDAEDAQRITERFFTRLFENKAHIKTNFHPERGRLQRWVLMLLQGFVAHELATVQAWTEHWEKLNQSGRVLPGEFRTRIRLEEAAAESTEESQE